MKNHYQYLKDYFVNSCNSYLGIIDRDETSESYMSYPVKWNGIIEAGYFGAAISYPLIAYYIPDHPRYHDITLLHDSIEALRQYKKYIHSDGTVDFRATNFHDPAQTGFNAQENFSCIELIDKLNAGTPEEEALRAEMRECMRLQGDAMLTLGFHTPNHRWVISSALAAVYNQFPEQKYLDGIGRFLSEGIDCDEHGEYTERSSGHYNNVCNQAFIELAHQLGDESFLEYPRRNLNLMKSFVEPDYTMNSLNSTRMDNAQIRKYDEYYPYYLYMALKQKNPGFAYLADEMLDRLMTGKATPTFPISQIIRMFLTEPELLEAQETLIPKKPEGERSVYLPDSGIARIYNKENDMTVTLYRGHTPTFIKIQYKEHVLYGRFAGAFFGDPHSQFRPTVLEPSGDGFRLYSEEHAGYRSQLDTPPETSFWRQMDHSKRHWINIQNFTVEMFVHIGEDEVTIDVSAGGCDLIPTKFEFSLDAGFRLHSGDVDVATRDGDYIYNSGKVNCMFTDLSSFEISGGFVNHHYAQNMRGAVPYDTSRVTVAMTGSTPHKNTVKIKLIRNN